MATLYIIATPIGNLKDITLRALETLKKVDFILCEDTRNTQCLLNYFEIKKPIISYHEHSKIKKIDYISELLKEGKNLALVSDAGTPGISDPGNKLIETLLQRFSSPEALKIIPLPGASALIALASISGWPMNKFLFLGFPPTKRKKQKFLNEIVTSSYPVIFYESIYRILKTLQELQKILLKEKIEYQIIVGRELTKKFETIYRGKIEEIIPQLTKESLKGEMVVGFKRC